MGLMDAYNDMLARHEQRQDAIKSESDKAVKKVNDEAGKLWPASLSGVNLYQNPTGEEVTGSGYPKHWMISTFGGKMTIEPDLFLNYGYFRSETATPAELAFYEETDSMPWEEMFRGCAIQFWRFSWDMTAGRMLDDGYDHFNILQFPRVNHNGQASCIIKADSEATRAALRYQHMVQLGSGEWYQHHFRASSHPSNDLFQRFNTPGVRMNYEGCPLQGHVIIGMPQVTPYYFPPSAEIVVLPALQQVTDANGTRVEINFAGTMM